MVVSKDSKRVDPAISICILTYNRCSLLRQLLTELMHLEYYPLEIIVLDNHSKDMTERMMSEEFPGVTCIRTAENMGAAGRNIAMKRARGDIIVTLDDDVSGLTDEALRVLAREFEEDRRLGAVNFRVTQGDGRTCNWVHHCREEEFFDKNFLTYEITEGAVAFRREALGVAGYYPDGFFLSHEGPDLAFRIFDHGFKVAYSGGIAVRHSFAEEGREAWRNYYYDTRNQFWLAARHLPTSYAITYLARGVLSMLVYSARDGYVRYWCKAVSDGVKGLKEALKERKVLNDRTMDIIRTIDSQRPSVVYLVKNRLIGRKDLLFR
jgi:GT2 family glycosyltransferase